MIPRLLRSAVLAAGAAGGLSGAAYGLLSEQSRRARKVIGGRRRDAPRRDGYYLPDGTDYLPDGTDPTDAIPEALVFAMVGDSSAAGLGVDVAAQLPGVLLARGLAEETGRPVRLVTHAASGAFTRGLAGQVDAALADRPDVALVIIGVNDVTGTLPLRESARLLGDGVARLRAAGAAVVVGTCPDLGAVRPIRQPLRSVARGLSLRLARLQRDAVLAAGGYPVPLADLLSPQFRSRPAELFSADNFHPNAAGYAAAAAVLLPAVCEAAGGWTGVTPDPTADPRAERTLRPTARAVSMVNRALRRERLVGT